MAKPTAVAVKAEAANIATALNAALGDTILTGIAVGWQDPAHPIRQIERWVSMNDAGVFVADDAYIDAAHADSKYVKPRGTNMDRRTNDPA